MDDGESILDVIQEEDYLEDIDMLDVEEGEMVEEGELVEVQNSHVESGEIINRTNNEVNTSVVSKNRKRRNNKKKNKKKKSIPGSNVTDVNRLVLDVCRRLKEKKSYLVYTAVGCLGTSAFCDLVKEVDAIQTCGGQKTADGKRFRTGGGILWNILKTREPNAYREIMKKGREFEMQFKQTNKIESLITKDDASKMESSAAGNEVNGSLPSGSQNPTPEQNQDVQRKSQEKRVSVHERMRVPVTYDDLLGDGGEDQTST